MFCAFFWRSSSIRLSFAVDHGVGFIFLGLFALVFRESWAAFCRTEQSLVVSGSMDSDVAEDISWFASVSNVCSIGIVRAW